ncbi:MAG: YciI-like protein [Acidimicrobiales bacterium]
MYYLLQYDVVDDYTERRAPHREEHLELAREAHGRGELVLAGAFASPADGAALVFKAHDISVVERFAANDPYVKAGVVTRWKAREWAVVVGGE